MYGSDLFVAAFQRGAEGVEQRQFTEGFVQEFCGLHRLFDVQGVLIKVGTPLYEIHCIVFEFRCFFKNSFPGLGHDGNDDLRCPCADLQVPDHDSIH